MKSIYPVYLKMGLILAVVILSFMAVSQCQAQEVLITKKNGDRIEQRVQGTSPTQIYFAGGSVSLADIDNVYIKTEGKVADNFASYLTKNNITITRVEPKKVEIKKPIVTADVVEEKVLDLDQSIEKFRVQRQTGKAMQLIGVLVIGGASALQASFNKQYQDDYKAYLNGKIKKEPQPELVSPYISMGGVAISAVGFIIDIDAGRHLKRKR